MKLEKLAPAFQDYLWGGTKLRDVYGKRCDFDKVAESWELSTHPAGESALAGGERDGLPLGQYFQQFPQALGKNAAAFESFPLLIKLIDRECDATSYDLIRVYRGKFSAFFWQGFAKIFGADLKAEYDTSDYETQVIERIITLVEAGML